MSETATARALGVNQESSKARTEAPGGRFGVAFAMPSRWTFKQPPVADFLARHTAGRRCIVDPFCGESTIAHHRNDLARGGVDAETFVRGLLAAGVRADCVIFDPPYSPRQISECYKGIGRPVTREDTQNARLYARVRAALADILDPSGIALSFGWQSAGFGRSWRTVETLLVQHGGAHTDTICVAQMPPERALVLAVELSRSTPQTSPALATTLVSAPPLSAGARP